MATIVKVRQHNDNIWDNKINCIVIYEMGITNDNPNDNLIMLGM